MVTTAVGAILNVGLNLLLIPQYGVNGATFATLVGYLCVFVLRAIDTRRYIRIRMNVTKMIFNTAVLGAQCAVMILELPYWIAWEIGLTLLMIVTNLGGIVMTLQKLLAKRLGGKGRTDDN